MKAGDKDRLAIYENLLQRYGSALRRLAWSYARDAIEDLFQEIALGLWKAIPHFRGDASERTWLYCIAHNIAISTMGSRRKRERSELPMADSVAARSFR